jgi:hypothetical protein
MGDDVIDLTARRKLREGEYEFRIWPYDFDPRHVGPHVRGDVVFECLPTWVVEGNVEPGAGIYMTPDDAERLGIALIQAAKEARKEGEA